MRWAHYATIGKGQADTGRRKGRLRVISLRARIPNRWLPSGPFEPSPTPSTATLT